MKLPEGVKAFFSSKAANVSEENEKLATATIGDLNYSNTKEKSQNILSNPVVGEGAASAPVVKSQPLFQTYSPRGSWHSHGRGERGS